MLPLNGERVSGNSERSGHSCAVASEPRPQTTTPAKLATLANDLDLAKSPCAEPPHRLEGAKFGIVPLLCRVRWSKPTRRADRRLAYSNISNLDLGQLPHAVEDRVLAATGADVEARRI
jgi:hypothetical protein